MILYHYPDKDEADRKVLQHYLVTAHDEDEDADYEWQRLSPSYWTNDPV